MKLLGWNLIYERQLGRHRDIVYGSWDRDGNHRKTRNNFHWHGKMLKIYIYYMYIRVREEKRNKIEKRTRIVNTNTCNKTRRLLRNKKNRELTSWYWKGLIEIREYIINSKKKKNRERER